MILYTPMQLELVLEGMNDKQNNQKEIKVDNKLLLVESMGNGKAKIVRLISTDPNDYLKKEYLPGNLINDLCND